MQEQSLDNETVSIYKIKKRVVFISVIVAMASLTLGFVTNFSLENKIIGLLNRTLKKNRTCPIQYKSAKLSYFLPTLLMDEIEISGRCFNKRNALLVDKAQIGLTLPSMTPMGLALSTKISEIDGLDSQINIKSIHNFSTQYIRIDDSNINIASFQNLMGKLKLQGNFNINALIATDLKELSELDLHIMSKNFIIPGQTINNFDIPTLLISNLSLKATAPKKNVVEIKEFIVGTADSPIRANVTGTININKKNINLSKLNLEAQVKFSKQFIEDFSIINLVLSSGQPDAQGFYRMSIGGTLGRPGTPKIIK